MISIIIPARNEELILENALKALSLYSGEKEIIVSDDGSIDKTVEIAKKYTDKVLIYNGDIKRKISGVRNAGAKVATGDYLVFIDADVTVKDSDMVFKILISLFEKDSKLVGATVFIRFLPETESFADKVIMYCMNMVHLFYNNVAHFGGASGQFQMIRRDAFEKIGGYNVEIVAAEDEDVFQRLAKIGKTHSEKSITVYETGRRAHKIGWPKLLWQWNSNAFYVIFFKKAYHSEWEEIR